MADQRIDGLPPGLRAATGVQRTGTATDRKPRRQEREDRRKGDEGPRKRRHLFDLLFEEIDQVPELEAHQRERLKRNIRAHMALRARDGATAFADAGRPETPAAYATPPPAGGDHETAPPATDGDSTPPAGDGDSDHDPLINLAAPQTPDLSPDELALNAELARQLRECLTRNTEAARKVAAYLKILLSIDGTLAPHVVIDI